MDRNMLKKVLEYYDEFLYSFLLKNRDIMPNRFKKIIAQFYPDARIRKQYLEEFSVKMQEGTYSNIGLTVISDGANTPMVEIGRNVSIAPFVTFICDSNPNNAIELKNIEYVKNKLIKNEKIIIEDEVWIGANVTILPGVIIKKGCIIGAGSVVTKNTEPYYIYVGVPARKLKKIK
ncbi:maltose O-acetyltransferase [Hathewaya proteolytica DSM 3090]|uniref:Maltose O-acetyltransferase n=1 Tax=Hathewaya proteolytica DSM 3090 TaxID=1121331 RepID=A0A1M6JRR7_9CLOT|nr:acyltransferase [Hathewaya proteolytica]SHJ49384.1 maltose O-acetyltransferase [Hathewaya proteolytica DSM 3090]